MSYISQEGIDRFKKELEELKFKRQEVAKRLEEAKALGDLSENTEYLQAREAQAFNEGRIIEIENILKEAIVINKKKKNGYVQIGSTVKVKNNRNQKIFTIVGPQEAHPKEGRISNESPLGKAFLNKKIGDTVEAKTPGGIVKYKIILIK